MAVTDELGLGEVAQILRLATDGLDPAGFGLAIHTSAELLQVAIGSADPVRDVPMTTETLVQIGSSTKLLNAAMVMRLAESGQLDLDRPIHELVPTLPWSDIDPSSSLTLRHCLTMSSGLDGPYVDLGTDEGHLEKYVKGLAAIAPLFRPGAGFGYSNASSILAGCTAELIARESWDALLKRLVLDPIGMTRTETTAQELPFHPVAVGIHPDGTVVRPWYLSRSMGPAGSTCVSTAGDLVLFGRMMLDGGRVGSTEVLKGDTVRTMCEPVVQVATGIPADAWCLGPARIDSGSHIALGHPGLNSSGCSVVWWVPDLDVAVACVSNSPSSYGRVMEISFQVLERLGWARPEAAVGSPAAVPGADELAGIYESHLLRYEVVLDGGQLMLRVTARAEMMGDYEARARLVPAGSQKFVPEEPMTPGLETPTVFAFVDYAGTRVLLDGNAPAAKVA